MFLSKASRQDSGFGVGPDQGLLVDVVIKGFDDNFDAAQLLSVSTKLTQGIENQFLGFVSPFRSRIGSAKEGNPYRSHLNRFINAGLAAIHRHTAFRRIKAIDVQ